MHTVRNLALIIVFGMSPLLAGCAAAPSSSEARIDALFAELDRDDGPGAAVLVVRDGEVMYRKGFGRADLEHDVPIGPSTVFDIASVSKQFAGMAVAMLVESGRIRLEDDIRAHLPEMPAFGTTVTVDHLVHHTSGIRDWPGTLAVAGWRMDDVISFEQILTMARNQRDLNFTPGAEYSYSNTGYNLLAELVERISGESFRAWTDAEIFEPLGMSDTHFHDDHTEIVPNRAQGYAPTADGWQTVPNGLTALGSSSLYTTVDDLGRWMLNFDDPRVGGQSVIERMEQQGVLLDGARIPYAFGQSVGDHRGLETWGHTGSWAGFRTALLRFPEQRFGVVILSNAADYDPWPVAHAVADVFLEDVLGEAPADSEPEAASGTSEPARPTPAPARPALTDYVGEFHSRELDTSWWLAIRDGRLVAHHRRHGDVALTPVGRDAFASDQWFLPSLEFDRDDRGDVLGLRITQGRSRNMRFEVREPPSGGVR